MILQRQTGGDLAEILDKIGALIRDRFRIWGQVQALTGEGRLSGIVLLALPVVLFLAVYQLNREYVMVLFTDPMGTKMLAVGGDHADPRRLDHSQNRQHQGVAVIFAAEPVQLFEAVVPMALFGTFAAIAWWALDLMSSDTLRAAERLDELKDPHRRRKAAASALKKTDALTRVLERASPSLAKPLQPKNKAELGKLKTKLSNAGFRSEAAGTIFLGFKLAGLVTGLLARRRTGHRAPRRQSKLADLVDRPWVACCSTCPTWSSASSAAGASRRSFSPCPTPWT